MPFEVTNRVGFKSAAQPDPVKVKKANRMQNKFAQEMGRPVSIRMTRRRPEDARGGVQIVMGLEVDREFGAVEVEG